MLLLKVLGLPDDLLVPQLAAEEMDLLCLMEQRPLGLRILASALMHKTVTAGDVSSQLRSVAHCSFSTSR